MKDIFLNDVSFLFSPYLLIFLLIKNTNGGSARLNVNV